MGECVDCVAYLQMRYLFFITEIIEHQHRLVLMCPFVRGDGMRAHVKPFKVSPTKRVIVLCEQ